MPRFDDPIASSRVEGYSTRKCKISSGEALCLFNEISQKAIDPNKLTRLQNDVVQCLVSFEMVFPPSFFNIMTHLLVHIVKEINILGHVFLHNLFPFER